MDCLNLIKFKDYCKVGDIGPFVSDYIDLSNVMLSHLANDSESSGKQYAEQLINAAMAQVEANIMLSASNGYSISNIVYYYNNTCRFTDSYSNWGVALTNFFRSNNSKLFVSEVSFKPEVTGTFILVIDDGFTLTEYSVSGTAGVESSVTMDYSTIQKQIKIYAKDSTLKFAMLSCQTGGCGSCAAKRGVHLQMQGWNRASVNSQPTGFIPKAYIACDMDSVICSIVTRHKALFSKAIAYQVGIMAYTRILISPRLNDTTLNIDATAVKLYLDTLEAKYKELMWGSVPAYGNASTTGVIKIMQDSYRTMGDACVICGSQINSATATF